MNEKSKEINLRGGEILARALKEKALSMCLRLPVAFVTLRLKGL